MLDVEYVKTLLQAEVDEREKARAKCEKFHTSGNKHLEECYERRYHRYCDRFVGMCDMLYNLGFLAWADDENEVFVEKRVTFGDLPF